MKRCYNCYEHNEFYKDDDYLCKVCTDMGRRMIPIPVHGCSDGPGTSQNVMVFEKPDAKKDIMLTAKKLESSGAFKKNPKMKEYAEYKVKKAKEMPDTSGVDYGKTGHPAVDG